MSIPAQKFFLPHKKDPRQWQHQRSFGSIHPIKLPETLNRKPLSVFDQGTTSFCTAYAAAGAMTFRYKKVVSPEFQTAKEGELLGNPILNGTNMDTPCKALRKYGFVQRSMVKISLLKNRAIKVSNWKNYPANLNLFAMKNKQGGYYDAHTGKFDAFDNIRSTIYKSSQKGKTMTVMMGTPWYKEFNNVAINTPSKIVPIPITKPISEHAWLIYDWEPDGTGDYNALALLSNGKKFGKNGIMRFPRDVVNFLFTYPYADTRIVEDRAQTAWKLKAIIIKLLIEVVYKLKLLIAKKNPDSYSYPWDTPKHNWHNVRVLCDKEGLSYGQKNIICACIYQESRFNNNAIHQNKNKTTDWGIVQVNDYWHIGYGKQFASVQYVIKHPEETVSWMIRMYKIRRLNEWVSYSSGAYKKWIPKDSMMWELA